MLWDCEHCGTKNIAPSVPFCPNCFVPREVAAEPGQIVEDPSGSPVGSQTDGSPPPSGDSSAKVPPSPTSSSKDNSDWGKE